MAFSNPSVRANEYPVLNSQKRVAAIQLLLVFLFASPLLSQNGGANPGVGFPSFGSFRSSEFDTINEGNLNIHFSIPVFQKSGRGLSVNSTIAYDSLIWTAAPPQTDADGNIIQSAQFMPPAVNPWGWTLSPFTSYVTYTRAQTPPSTCPDGTGIWIRSNYAYHSSDGTVHSMGAYQAIEANCNGVPQGFGPVMAQDDSGYSLTVTSSMAAYVTTVSGNLILGMEQFQVFGPLQGLTFNMGAQVIDTNGNELTFSGTELTDTLGVQAMQVSDTATSASLTYPSPTNPSTFIGVTLNFTTYTVQTKFGCHLLDYGPLTAQLVSSIKMPDGSTYSFTYEATPGVPANTTGRLASVTLPSGGTITYTYGGVDCSDGSNESLTRTTPDGTWTYTRQITETPFTNGYPGEITSSITTVTDPLGNVSVINFAGGQFETKRQIYTGSSTLLETIETCYNGASFPCTATAVTPPIQRRTVRKEIPNTTGQVSETDTYLNPAGLTTDVYAYDFGSGSPGALISHTATTYNSLSETISSDPVTISNRPATVTVTNVSGTTMSQSSYFYDQTTPTPTSGLPQHIAVTGSRGNLTTLQRLVQGTTTIQKTTSYNDTGTVAIDNDFKGNPAATYVYGTNSCGGSFPTTITDAMSMSETIVWDCNGGVKTSVEDANLQITSYTYSDPNYWRLSETGFPDGGQVATSYNLGTNRPWNIVTNSKLTSTQEITRTTLYDTLARVSQQQLNSDPENADLTNTTYDSAGHVHSVSNPYRTTADSTYGLTSYTYDGLGRVTLQTEPDGSSVATSYNSNCTTVTDEAGTLRESCTDGLGRLTEVEEPGPGAQAATAGGKSISISGTSDQSGTFNMCPNNPNGPCWETIPDTGTISITVDSFPVSTTYGPGSSASGIASALVTALNGPTSPVSASLSGSTVVIASRELGVGGDFSWSASVSWTSYFNVPSFSPCGSGVGSCSGSLSGGVNASLGTSPLITLYQYDALGNLLCVEQHGNATTGTGCSSPQSDDATSPWRVRRFTYDSLSRLLTASNPESGTITYTYDNNGNVLTKVSPQPNSGTSTITTSYSYDALNRLTKKSYTGITMPVAQYGYDGVALTGCTVAPFSITSPTNLKGRESEMCFGSSTSVFSYDPMGRVAVENTNDVNSSNGTAGKSILYSYYLDGEPHTLTYPSGTVVTYTATTAGRISTVSDPSNTYVATPSTAPMYSAAGLLVGMKNGSAISTANAYNSRLQPVTLSAETTSATLMSLSYNFHSGAGDNGNIFQITDNIDSTRSTAFQYDLLNRISQANTITTSGANCWGEVYTIDSWGNLTNRSGPSGMGGCSTEGLSLSASLKNQLVGLSYDAAGNVTNDGSGNSPTYDAENRIITDAGVTYSYDAGGNRMEKSSGTFYWYGAGGAVLAESDLSGNINEEYIFFNGQRIARVDRPSGTVHYYFSDQLGSASVIASASGSVQEQYFYYPYGGMQSSVGSDPNHYKFNGKEWDSESGLDT
jgi:YD repeat-containing protein